jgi:hypothetical protein
MDYINGFLDAIGRIAAAHHADAYHEAHFECLHTGTYTHDLPTLVLARLAEKHARRCQNSTPDSKYYYASKPQQWQKALAKVALLPADAAAFSAEVASFCAVERPTTAAALGNRFVELLSQTLAPAADWKYYALSNMPFPLSFAHDDAVNASHEFIIAAENVGIYYLGLRLMRG